MHPNAPQTQLAETLTLRIAETESGARLDAYLAAHLADWSRARIRRLIEAGDVMVEGRVVKPSYKLRADDEIEIELVAPPHAKFSAEDIPIEIVYEDADLAIVNKPAGLVVHPGAGALSGTLANALAFRFQSLPNQDDETNKRAQTARPGIVHRLDKNTSGLIVVALTESAHKNLSEQFRSREVFKSYVALAHGRFENDHGIIDQPIGRDPARRTRMAVVRSGRQAVSVYSVRRRYERFTLLDVEIKTGRTHQIRAHLEWLKHPIVGDKLYNAGRDRVIQDARLRARVQALDRQFLHAGQLRFRHPRTNEMMSFTAPLPAPLAVLLELLA